MSIRAIISLVLSYFAATVVGVPCLAGVPGLNVFFDQSTGKDVLTLQLSNSSLDCLQVVLRQSANADEFDLVVNDDVHSTYEKAALEGLDFDAGGGEDSLMFDVFGLNDLECITFRGRGGIDVFKYDNSEPMPISANNDITFNIRGGGGDDHLEIISYPGGVVFYGNEGNDKLIGSNGDDTLKGNDGDDVLRGGVGEDKLFGADGDDNLHGGSQADELDGGSGDDILWGNGGDDTIYGQEGLDRLVGGAGLDILDGGPDADKIFLYSPPQYDHVFQLDPFAGAEELHQAFMSLSDGDCIDLPNNAEISGQKFLVSVPVTINGNNSTITANMDNNGEHHFVLQLRGDGVTHLNNLIVDGGLASIPPVVGIGQQNNILINNVDGSFVLDNVQSRNIAKQAGLIADTHASCVDSNAWYLEMRDCTIQNPGRRGIYIRSKPRGSNPGSSYMRGAMILDTDIDLDDNSYFGQIPVDLIGQRRYVNVSGYEGASEDGGILIDGGEWTSNADFDPQQILDVDGFLLEYVDGNRRSALFDPGEEGNQLLHNLELKNLTINHTGSSENFIKITKVYDALCEDIECHTTIGDGINRYFWSFASELNSDTDITLHGVTSDSYIKMLGQIGKLTLEECHIGVNTVNRYGILNAHRTNELMITDTTLHNVYGFGIRGALNPPTTGSYTDLTITTVPDPNPSNPSAPPPIYLFQHHMLNSIRSTSDSTVGLGDWETDITVVRIANHDSGVYLSNTTEARLALTRNANHDYRFNEHLGSHAGNTGPSTRLPAPPFSGWSGTRVDGTTIWNVNYGQPDSIYPEKWVYDGTSWIPN